MNFVSDLFENVLEEAAPPAASLLAASAERGSFAAFERTLAAGRLSIASDMEEVCAIARLPDEVGVGHAQTLIEWAQAGCGASAARHSQLLAALIGRQEAARPKMLALLLGQVGTPDWGASLVEPLPGARVLAGARAGLVVREESPLARAIDHGLDMAPWMAAAQRLGPSVSSPVARVESGERRSAASAGGAPLDAIGFAIVCDELECAAELIALTPAQDRVLACTRALRALVASGLSESGPDPVHAGMLMLLAAGASPLVEGGSLADYPIDVGADPANRTRVLFPAMIAWVNDERGAIGALDVLRAQGALELNAVLGEPGSGRRLAHFAALAGREALISHLHELGANLSIRDARGVTPARYAHLGGHMPTVSLLTFLTDDLPESGAPIRVAGLSDEIEAVRDSSAFGAPTPTSAPSARPVPAAPPPAAAPQSAFDRLRSRQMQRAADPKPAPPPEPESKAARSLFSGGAKPAGF